MSSAASPITDKSSKATASDSASASEQPMTAADLVATAFQDERTDLRDRCRLGLYLNAISHTQMDVMSMYVLDSVQDTAPDIREYVARKCNKPIAEQPIIPENTSEEDRGAFLSINGCREIAVFNYGWISRIVEGTGIKVVERTYYYPKPARQAKLRIGDNKPSDKVCAHTVLVLKPSDEEGVHVVVDPTHLQFGFKESINELDSYEKNKTKANMVGKPYESYNLGEAAQWHAEGMHRTPFSKARAQITTNETNNAVMEQLRRLNGIDAFWNLSPRGFREVLEDKDNVVREALTKKRMALDQVEHNRDGNYEARLFKLIAESDGDGHQECVQSFQRYVYIPFYDSDSD